MAVKITKAGKLVRPKVGHSRFLTHPEVSWVVCAECLMYHNTSFEDGTGPYPPLHVGCNCTRTPEVDLSFHDYAFWTPDAKLEKPSQPYDRLKKFVRGASVFELERVFGGRTIAALIKSGRLKPEQAVTRMSGVKTLKQVKGDVKSLKDVKVDRRSLAEIRESTEDNEE